MNPDQVGRTISVKIETAWPTGELLLPQLIRIVYWCGRDQLQLLPVTIRMVTDIDTESIEATVTYALVEFFIPEGVTFDAAALVDPEAGAVRKHDVIVKVL